MWRRYQKIIFFLIVIPHTAFFLFLKFFIRKFEIFFAPFYQFQFFLNRRSRQEDTRVCEWVNTKKKGNYIFWIIFFPSLHSSHSLSLTLFR